MSDVRLIDANELKRDFAELCATECPICSFYIPNADVGDCHCGLIDRAPTVEAYTKDDMTKEYLKGYNACKDIIQPTGEWIPVSERLPKESLNSVIGYDAYRERCVFVQFIDGHFQITGNDESFNIVAWMPMPKPYKGEEE